MPYTIKSPRRFERVTGGVQFPHVFPETRSDTELHISDAEQNAGRPISGRMPWMINTNFRLTAAPRHS
jgi:hypothetical protein